MCGNQFGMCHFGIAAGGHRLSQRKPIVSEQNDVSPSNLLINKAVEQSTYGPAIDLLITADTYAGGDAPGPYYDAIWTLQIAALREAGLEEEFDKLTPGSGLHLFFSPIRNAIIRY